MELISLKDIESAVRILRHHTTLPSELIQRWVKDLDRLLPEEIRDDQIEYAIAKSSKEQFDKKDYSSISLALVRLCQILAKRQHYTSVVSHLQTIVDKAEPENSDKSEELLKAWQNHLKQYDYRRPIYTRPNYFPLLVDQLLRWSALGIWGPAGQSLDDWENSDAVDYFMFAQLLIIPILTLIITLVQNSINVKNNKELLAKSNLSHRIFLKKSVSQVYYFFLFFIVALGCGMTYVIDGDNFELSEIIISVIVWVAFLLLYHSFNTGALSEEQLGNQLQDTVDFTSTLELDQNDEILVKLSEKLQAIMGQLDAYVLESALFGALAFSGFLQIMAENLVTVEAIEEFAHGVYMVFEGLVFFDAARLDLNFLFSTSSLFSLIAVETLVCSILFLAVIASRLKFSNIADSTKYHIQVAASYNLKEEMLDNSNGDSESDTRLKMLNFKIHDTLNEADNILNQIRPISGFMRFFRNGGIITFLIILITSALLISPILSGVFVAMSLSILVYFNSRAILNRLHALRYWTQYLVIHHNNVILLTSIILLVAGTVLSMYYQFSYYHLLINSAFSLLILYRISVIFFISPVDVKFPSVNPLSLNLKIFWALGELISFIAIWNALVYSVWLEYDIAGMLVLFAVLLIMSIQLANIRWLGILVGLASVSCLFSLMFSMPYSNTHLAILFLTVLAILIILRKKRESIHRQTKYLIFIMSILLFYPETGMRYHSTAIRLQTSNFDDIKLFRQAQRPFKTEKEFENLSESIQLLKTKYDSESASEFKKDYLEKIMLNVYWRMCPCYKSDDDFILNKNIYDQIVSMSKEMNPDCLDEDRWKRLVRWEKILFSKSNEGLRFSPPQ